LIHLDYSPGTFSQIRFFLLEQSLFSFSPFFSNHWLYLVTKLRLVTHVLQALLADLQSQAFRREIGYALLNTTVHIRYASRACSAGITKQSLVTSKISFALRPSINSSLFAHRIGQGPCGPFPS
jgi:signal transduction histidine kinase